MPEDPRKVVVLDRDGTIVMDRHYLADPDDLVFEPGAERGLRAMAALGCRLVIATNQSGIARGYLDIPRLQEIHTRLAHMLNVIGVRLEGVYFCPHGPADGCECRKPKLGLMRRASAELGFDMAQAVVIGDKDSDVEFGRRAGAMTMRVGANRAASPGANADHEVQDLEAAACILARLAEAQ